MKERPKNAESITLAALHTAASSARSFVVSTLVRWDVPVSIHAAMVLTEEMVHNAVRAVGVPDPDVDWAKLPALETITVRLVHLHRSIGIEVADSTRYVQSQNNGVDQIDEALLTTLQVAAGQWGIIPAGRGRLIWAQLLAFERTESGLPIRPFVPSPRPREPVDKILGEDLLRRVRDGLDKL